MTGLFGRSSFTRWYSNGPLPFINDKVPSISQIIAWGRVSSCLRINLSLAGDSFSWFTISWDISGKYVLKNLRNTASPTLRVLFVSRQ